MQLTDEQLDALKELFNLGIGQAASLLNEIVDSHICLQMLDLRSLSEEEALQHLHCQIDSTSVSTVSLDFKGSLSGTAELLFPTQSAAQLVAFLNEDEDDLDDDLDSLKVGTLTEVGNIVINGVMAPIASTLGCYLNYSIPTYIEGKIDDVFSAHPQFVDKDIILGTAGFFGESMKIVGEVVLVFQVGPLLNLLSNLLAD